MDIFVPFQFLLYNKNKSWLNVLSAQQQFLISCPSNAKRQQILVNNKCSFIVVLRLRATLRDAYSFILFCHFVWNFLCPSSSSVLFLPSCQSWSRVQYFPWHTLSLPILKCSWPSLNFYYLTHCQLVPCSWRTDTHASVALQNLRQGLHTLYRVGSIKCAEESEDTSWYAQLSKAWYLLEITKHYRQFLYLDSLKYFFSSLCTICQIWDTQLL